MASSRKDSDTTEYALKKGGDDVPVDACKGWMDACEYCNKRFCDWISVNEEIYEKIPEKPGFFMIALKNKNITEVVSILFSQTNIQKIAFEKIDDIKEQISNKRSKATKSAMLIRWMIIKKIEDKENCILCAHWCNNGLLPKFITSWPGMNLLENSDTLNFSKYLQKWCYLKKNPVWRKPKPIQSKTVEEIKKCDFSSCEVCDSYFTPWKQLSDVLENNLAPEYPGLVIFSIVYGKSREIVLISNDKKSIVLNIKSTILQYFQKERHYLNFQKFAKKNAHSEVRWMVTEDTKSDNACFLYAHWLNANTKPIFNYDHMPGERELDLNKHFVIRNQDKMWMYETESFKPTKFNKEKNRRKIFEELRDGEEYFETIS